MVNQNPFSPDSRQQGLRSPDQMGTHIQVVSIAYPSEQHEAVVSAISPVVEKNGMVHLEATLQPHPHLMPGMTAIVSNN